ncbi:MAG TPA: adenylate/guanylate cyclase domain-containing protein, partial [Actinomycetota bacterium]|nr:adenylate/guanylate cyclase domain-containing protein [Actinomycetota bacterium]
MTDVTTCPNCGSENPSGFRFCGTCGRPLAPVAPFTADRRSVTVLFADLVGFSTMAEQMDTEEVHALITELFAKLSRVVERRDGRVEKFVGDAVLAVFGAPAAHEDDPRRAVESALEMLDVVSRSSSSTLRLRIGINSGPVVAARSEHGETGLFGDAVNVAARLQQVAEPDQILVSEAVWRRVRREFDGTPVGALKVKGRSQPVDAVRVLGAKPTAAPHHGPFVGRRDERALLELLWSSVERGNTHVVTIVGEPGVGKSRLLAELPPRDVAVDARVTCGPDRAFGPFIEVLEGVLGGRPADLDELDAGVAALGIEAGAARGLASLLGLRAAATADATDEQQKRQLFGAVLAFLTQAAGRGPLHVVLDDVHWADPSSLDLLEFLLGRLGGIPLMLILARRPAPRGTEDRVGPRASHTTIQLEPLTDEESEELVRRFLAVDDIPEDLQRTVVDRAEGNPFFIEELLRSLLELGSLTCQGSRAFLESTTLDVPDTVQGTILARIDRLPAEDRLVLQHAAVLGRGFSTGLLETILGSPDVIQRLDALSGAQLVVPGDDDRWSFKHALIEEVVYESLLQKQRHQIHQRAAEALEPKASDDPALLA